MRRAVENAATVAVGATAGPTAAAASRPVISRLSKWWWALLVVPVMLGTLFLSGVLTLTSVINGTAALAQSNASVASGWCFADGDVEATGWDGEQLEVATTIAEVWAENDLPPKGLVVAYATGIVESGMRNLDGGHADSLGWAQQRPSAGWGTPQQILDVRLASEAFFGVAAHTDNPGLVDVVDWKTRPVGEVAQLIQRSAFPLRYAEEEKKAQALASLVLDQDVITCQEIAAGDWTWPMADGSYAQPFSAGQLFGMRVHPVTGVFKLHSGLDFSAPAGTPIYAATGGLVAISGAGGAWGNQVVVHHADGVQTRYAHASELLVDVGDQVEAGEPVALVGTTGYSTGNHLHFEVIVDGRPVDPLPWLSGRAGER